jgi:hypothetical protein
VRSSTVCAGAQLESRLSDWLRASTQLLGADAHLTIAIKFLLDGTQQSADKLESTVRAASNSTYVRVGAAARLLLNNPDVELTLSLQLFLISAMEINLGSGNQHIWNKHVAYEFGKAWRALARYPIQFVAPRKTIPAILTVVGELEFGTGTLGILMSTVRTGIRGPSVPILDG